MKIAVIVRSHNENPRIVVENLRALDGALGARPQWEASVVLVEDGSRPPLSENDPGLRLKSAPVVLIRHPLQLGPGAALETGFEYIRRLPDPPDLIATFDPDGQHDPADLRAMMESLVADGFDPHRDKIALLGSRFLGTTVNISARRLILLKAARRLSNFFYGFNLTDVHNGLRVFTRPAVESLRLRSADFSYAGELVGELKKNDVLVREFPVTIRYTPYSTAKGQKDSNAFSILKEMLLRKLIP